MIAKKWLCSLHLEGRFRVDSATFKVSEYARVNVLLLVQASLKLTPLDHRNGTPSKSNLLSLIPIRCVLIVHFFRYIAKGNLRVEVVERAMEIVDDAVGIEQKSLINTSMDPPPNDEKAKKLRQDIFLYQTLRNRAVEAVHCINDQEYVVTKKLLSVYSVCPSFPLMNAAK